jgi:hypothetical protein
LALAEFLDLPVGIEIPAKNQFIVLTSFYFGFHVIPFVAMKVLSAIWKEM